MIHTLARNEYHKARGLFEGPHLRLVIDAVSAGNSPGRVWVDDRAYPRTALMWDDAHCWYLAGATENAATIGELARLFAESLAPEAAARDARVFKVYYTAPAGERAIGEIFGNAALRKLERVFYTFERPQVPGWNERIPPGFNMRPIDAGMLRETTLKNLPDLRAEIESCWNSVGDFLENGFGYCLLHGDEIVCRCTAEYVSAGKCGIGIETAEGYRERGFATLTAAAFVEHCVARGVTAHWDAWKANLPSIAVAEKVGFRKTVEYAVYLGELD